MLFFQKQIAVVILTLLPVLLMSQNGINFKKVDSLTYSYYLQHNWNDLLEVGNSGLDEGLDYYYLRMRMGIASYEIGNYVKAAKHFSKALDFNFNDPTAQLYLYDTYLYMGKNDLARKIRSSFSEKTKVSIEKKEPVISFVELGGGYVFSNNLDKNENPVSGSSGDIIPGSEIQIGDKSLAFALFGLNISPSLTYTFGVNNLGINKRSAFQYNVVEVVLDSTVYHPWGIQNHYSIDDSITRRTFNNTIKQNELYQSVKIQFDKQWSMTLFGNIIFVSTEIAHPKSNNAFIRRVNYRVIGQPPVPIDFPYDSVSFNAVDSSFVNYLVGFNLTKDLYNISFSLTGSYSSLNVSEQFQIGITSNYFLLPSAKLYGITSAYLFQENNEYVDDNAKFIFEQKFGGQLLKNLWYSLDFAYNIVSNSNFNNGYLLYNQSDDSKFNAGAKLSWFINNKISLSLYYKYANYEGIFYQYNPSGDVPSERISRTYINNNIIAGLSWKF